MRSNIYLYGLLLVAGSVAASGETPPAAAPANQVALPARRTSSVPSSTSLASLIPASKSVSSEASLLGAPSLPLPVPVEAPKPIKQPQLKSVAISSAGPSVPPLGAAIPTPAISTETPVVATIVPVMRIKAETPLKPSPTPAKPSEAAASTPVVISMKAMMERPAVTLTAAKSGDAHVTPAFVDAPLDPWAASLSSGSKPAAIISSSEEPVDQWSNSRGDTGVVNARVHPQSGASEDAYASIRASKDLAPSAPPAFASTGWSAEKVFAVQKDAATSSRMAREAASSQAAASEVAVKASLARAAASQKAAAARAAANAASYAQQNRAPLQLPSSVASVPVKTPPSAPAARSDSVAAVDANIRLSRSAAAQKAEAARWAAKVSATAQRTISIDP